LKFLSSSAGLLAESNQPADGPATDRIDEGFLDFPLSANKCRDGSEFLSRSCMLIMQPSKFKFCKTHPLALNTTKLFCQVMHFGVSQYINIPRFDFMLLLLKGQAGKKSRK
jgi:hypothetical protein